LIYEVEKVATFLATGWQQLATFWRKSQFKSGHHRESLIFILIFLPLRNSLRLPNAKRKSPPSTMKTVYLGIVGAIFTCACFLACPATHAADTDTNSAPNATNPSPRLVIVKAVYGDLSDPSTTSDVTEQVAGMVTNDTLTVDASNDNFGDPASGVTKLLRVDFTIDGLAGSKSVYERGKLKISLADKPNPGQTTGTPKLVIRKAVYGVLPDGDTIDVTTIMTGMVRNNSLTFTVNNDDLGDPAPYETKQLRVDYTLNGKEVSQSAVEGKTLTISSNGM
jgi:hypothetical protein